MSLTQSYRLAVYLLDPYKRKVLLTKSLEGSDQGKLAPICFPLPEEQSPQEFIQNFFKAKFNINVEFIFHQTSIPRVLDHCTVQTVAPFFTQVTCSQAGIKTTDFIYLAFVKLQFKLGDPQYNWCRAEDLVGRIAPRHVKRTVKHILQINQK